MKLSGVEQISYKDKETGAPSSFFLLYSASAVLRNGCGTKYTSYSVSDEVLESSGFTMGDLIDAVENGYQVFCDSRTIGGRNYASSLLILPQ